MRGSQRLASGQRKAQSRRPSDSGCNSGRRGSHRSRWTHLPGLFLLLLAGLLPAQAAPPNFGVQPSLVIPRVSRPPALEDFLGMEPNERVEGRLAKVEGFLQREPSDGAPATQRTEVYVGYDDKNLYLVFVCFDKEPEKIRARMVPRENIFGDDIVEVMLDTFHDQRRAFGFIANPHGIQWDGLWTEGQGWDGSFDTLWHSKGQRTPEGFVVWMAIPFRSLRFPATPEQTWGIVFLREVPRNNEESFWPRVSSRIEGRLNQAATLEGLENISPGRNVQLIPFGVFRSFRALDTRDPLAPKFVRDRADGDVGLDAKLVLKDSLVLDVALNPDFSQVESDEPQVTANQRFEVFFPEKRPFFLENAGFFQTTINLLFTRRIADPEFGVRLTGKAGPYALGAFIIDDESPGKAVPDDDPLHGKRALFSIFRVNRDLGRQSTLGFIYTDREFDRSFNRVGGLDGRFKLTDNWALRFQGVASSTRFLDGTGVAGPAYDARLQRNGRQLFYRLEYNDRSPGFRTEPGFLRRADIRRTRQRVSYSFRPEGKYLISWGPQFNTEAVFDHSGTRLDLTQDTSFTWHFVGQSQFTTVYNWDRERLRPKDFPVLRENVDFSRNRKGFLWTTSYIPQLTFRGNYAWGTRINFLPPVGQQQVLADLTTSTMIVTVRPVTSLRVDNSYIFFRLKDRGSKENIFNNHIARSRWNYQFNREFSLRVILQYDATLANPKLTSLETTKNFNADFLLTYLVNPGTVLFVGYNGNAQNIDVVPSATGSSIKRPRRRFINDAKQFFVKFSYLIRF